MIKIGQAPYLECSSAGDRRFSAFFAFPQSLDGVSIEAAYQGMKVLPDGRTGLHWRKAKGKQAINQQECAEAYERWWREWVEYAHLEDDLINASGLSDQFGEEGHVCQALVLWKIRGELIEKREQGA